MDKTRSIQISTRQRHGEIVMVEVHVGGYDDARLIWQVQMEMLALKFQIEGTWYYQSLHWSCRGGRPRYYRALAALYRYLVKHGLVEQGSLRKIASGARVFEIALDDTVLARGNEDSPAMSAYYRLRNMSIDQRRAEIAHYFGLDLRSRPKALTARILRSPMNRQPWSGTWDSLQLN